MAGESASDFCAKNSCSGCVNCSVSFFEPPITVKSKNEGRWTNPSHIKIDDKLDLVIDWDAKKAVLQLDGKKIELTPGKATVSEF